MNRRGLIGKIIVIIILAAIFLGGFYLTFGKDNLRFKTGRVTVDVGLDKEGVENDKDIDGYKIVEIIEEEEIEEELIDNEVDNAGENSLTDEISGEENVNLNTSILNSANENNSE